MILLICILTLVIAQDPSAESILNQDESNSNESIVNLNDVNDDSIPDESTQLATSAEQEETQISNEPASNENESS